MNVNNDKAQEKVIDRIRKLLALSQSPNENEAAVAAEKAQAMLAEYNLSLADVAEEGASGNDDVTVDEGGKTFSHPWQRWLANAIGELYFCKYYYTRDKPYKQSPYDTHHFVGAMHNIAVAKLMFEYLTETIERLAKEGMAKVPKKEKDPYRTSFRNACSLRLCQRIRDRIADAKVGKIKAETGVIVGGANLPALLSLYEKHDAANTAFLKENVGTLKTKTSRTRSSHRQGCADGDKAGGEIGLDGQVGSKKQAQISA